MPIKGTDTGAIQVPLWPIPLGGTPGTLMAYDSGHQVGPLPRGHKGKGPTCEYLLVPAPWAVLASGPLPLGRGPT